MKSHYAAEKAVGYTMENAVRRLQKMTIGNYALKECFLYTERTPQEYHLIYAPQNRSAFSRLDWIENDAFTPQIRVKLVSAGKSTFISIRPGIAVASLYRALIICAFFLCLLISQLWLLAMLFRHPGFPLAVALIPGVLLLGLLSIQGMLLAKVIRSAKKKIYSLF